MALSIRCNAINRPPLSQTAALILMLSSCALAKAPRMMRFASSSVSPIDPLLGLHSPPDAKGRDFSRPFVLNSGAGEGIRTPDPNLGKVYFASLTMLRDFAAGLPVLD